MTDWTSPLAHTYAAERPEASFAALARLGYRQPDHMVAAAEALAPRLGNRPTILDVACGYGTFGAVLRCYGTTAALFEAAAAGALGQREPARRPSPLAAARIVGLDIAVPAARFAVAAGFLDDAIAEDLTLGRPGEEAAGLLRGVTLVVEVGAEWSALGRLLPNLLPALAARPLVLLGPRGDAPSGPVFAALDRGGWSGARLTTRPLRFRRFADEDERRAAALREEQHGATASSDGDGYRAHLYLFEPRTG